MASSFVVALGNVREWYLATCTRGSGARADDRDQEAVSIRDADLLNVKRISSSTQRGCTGTSSRWLTSAWYLGANSDPSILEPAES